MMKNCNKLVKMISIALIVCFFCCNLQVSGFAAQNNDNSNNIVSNNQAICRIIDDENAVKNDITTYTADDIEPDAYESNDTRETATDYNLVTQLHGNAFNDGYRTANHHTSTDIDYYYIMLDAGVEVFVDLRNISTTREWHIEIEKENDDGTITQWKMSDENEEIQKNTSERFFYFKPAQTGKYYIKVSGSGEPDNFNYFMYVGPSKRRKVVFERKLFGSLKLYAGTYMESQIFDGTGLFYYPKYAKIDELELSNNYSGGYCSNIVKRITKVSTGSSYTSSTGSTKINNINGQYIAQKWKIEGKCGCGKSHSRTTWNPTIKVTCTYKAGPLPDNSVEE